MKYYLITLSANEKRELDLLIQCGYAYGIDSDNIATQNRAMKKFDNAAEITEGIMAGLKKRYRKTEVAK